jgi:SAM-dependent methyltransferase
MQCFKVVRFGWERWYKFAEGVLKLWLQDLYLQYQNLKSMPYTHKNLLATVFFLYFIQITFCQVDSSSTNIPVDLRVIQGLSLLRNNLIASAPQDIQDLKIIFEKLGENERMYKQYESQMNRMFGYSSAYDSYTPSQNFRYSGRSLQTSVRNLQTLSNDLSHSRLSEDEIDILRRQGHFCCLINEGVLSKKYPFVIKKDNPFFAEFEFYDIKNGDQIGEIGAGNGTFSLLMGLMYQGITIYPNELGVMKVAHFFNLVNTVPDMDTTNTWTPVLGTETETKFPENSLDKIVIRKAFHHFTEKKAMLESINKALKPDGYLLINELRTDSGPHSEYCTEFMSSKKVIKAIEKHGFQLKETREVPDGILLKFVKSKGK